MSAPAESRFVFGLMAGLAGACALGTVVTVPFAWAGTIGKTQRAKAAEWTLVPIVVYAVDVPKGAALTFDHLSQRSTPRFTIGAGIVRPDEAPQAINQRLIVDALAGEAVRWVDLAPKDTPCLPPSKAGP